MALDAENIFTYHAPFGNQAARYEGIRKFARAFADDILKWTPASPEQTLAIRKLQEVVMYANAAIALNERENRND